MRFSKNGADYVVMSSGKWVHRQVTFSRLRRDLNMAHPSNRTRSHDTKNTRIQDPGHTLRANRASETLMIWTVDETNANQVHIQPVPDDIQHEETTNCICGPCIHPMESIAPG